MINTEQEYIPDPLVYADIPDPDVIRVGNTFYMSSTTMYFSPGCPIMKSYDLVNWQIVNYVYDVLEDTDEFSLRNGKNAYGRGSWASSLRYHNGTFYVLFMSFTSNKSYIYQTNDIEHGKWKRQTFSTIFYDASLCFDDDGRVYIVSTSDGNFLLTELSADLSQCKPNGLNMKWIASTELKEGLKGEGVHIQKINGYYFLFVIAWPKNSMRTEYCFRSKKIEGPYERKIVLQDEGAAQGGIIDTEDGKWYGFVFRDNGPVGRTPVLVPVTWKEDWPVFGENGKIPHNSPYPISGKDKTFVFASDDFESANLKLEWQWNHNPDNSAWSTTQRPGFLRLTNSSTAKTFTQARNLLTQRTYGPSCSGETCIDTTNLKDGDTAGLAALQAKYAYVGVTQQGSKKFICMTTTMDSEKETYVERTEETVELNQDVVYLKETFDFPRNTVTFFYSLDSIKWKPIGKQLSMVYSLKHFTGYRFALFNLATKTTGGYVDFDYLHLSN